MPEIYPFKGWRYNGDIVKDLSKVITPPYDVIHEKDQESLYKLSPHNFIRIILNNNPIPEKYNDAARILDDWKNNSVIKQDDKESIYILSQSFKTNNRLIDRIGFIAKIHISDLGDKILPHEQTISKHINDRYELMKSTEANTGQIFMSYRDEERIIEKIGSTYKNKDTIIEIKIDNITYKVWRVDNDNEINEVKEMMINKKVIIADGHHRYKTAFKYNKDHPNKFGSNKVMVTLVNAYNKGMNVLPTHRIINDIKITENQLIEKISHCFKVEKNTSLENLLVKMEQNENGKVINIGMVSNSKNYYLLSYVGERQWSNKFSIASQSLDVNILHKFILKSGCGIDTNDQNDLKHISYIRGNESPLELINNLNRFNFIFLVNPPNLDQIFKIAESGETMPQKSTYFFPKVYSGLVFATIGD